MMDMAEVSGIAAPGNTLPIDYLADSSN